jgi:deoxyadenosine/deoxycytidine kinase
VSALARAVASATGSGLVTDPAASSPLRDQYAAHPARFAFQAQMHCLVARYQQQLELAQPDLFSPAGIVADYVFARDALFAEATLSADELTLYARIHDLLAPRIPSPDLVVYLTAPTEVLRARVRRFVASADRMIKLSVIDTLATAMDEYFFSYDGGALLVINTSELDIVERPHQLEELTEVIRRTRAGNHHFRPIAGGA